MRAPGVVRRAVVVGIGTLGLGCTTTPTSTASTDPAASWFPATPGRSWTFERRQGADVSKGIFRLEAGASPDTLTLAVENPRSGKSDRARVRADGDDVTIFWSSGRFELLRTPLSPGATWSWTDAGRRTEATVVGVEPMPVGGQSTECLHVRYASPGAPTQDYWFARGVGWVRIQLTSPGAPPDIRELATP